MTSKIGKRIGPVPIPIALAAVFALAALLSAGLLLLPGGAPDAEAQDSLMCTVNVDDAGQLSGLQGVGQTIQYQICTFWTDEPITLRFQGSPLSSETHTLHLLSEDPEGPVTAYPPRTVYNTDDNRFENHQGDPVSTKRYSLETIEVGPGRLGPNGDTIGSHTDVLVSKATEIEVLAGPQVAVKEGVPSDPDTTHENNGMRILSTANILLGEVRVIIRAPLGAPVIGVDSDRDRNTIVDDYLECLPGDNMVPESSNYNGETANCTPGGDDEPNIRDQTELRSRVKATTLDPAVNYFVYDGTSVTIPLPDTTDTVSIEATAQDAGIRNLEGIPITFSSTSRPASIDNQTRTHLTGGSGTTTTTPFLVSDLPTDTGFQVTVVVTAEHEDLAEPLVLGTVYINRTGPLTSLSANACAMLAADATDMDMMDGCMAGYDPMMQRYGAGDTVTIHALTLDTLGIPAGVEAMVKPAAVMGDYGDARDALDITDEGKTTADGMTTFTVKDDAPSGDYQLEVEARQDDGEDELVLMETITISVAGPPVNYVINGPDWIALGSFGTYTVTATDINGFVAGLREGVNDMVTVLVQPDTVLLEGLDGNMLMLDGMTGMGTFTIHAPLEAMDGEPGRIIVRAAGVSNIIHDINFGDAPPEMMAPGMPMNVMAMAMGSDMIDVSWDAPMDDGGSMVTGYMVQRAYMMSDGMMSDWMDVDPAHMGTGMMYTDTGLMPATTYYYRVAAMNDQGMGMYSDGTAMAMTEEMMAPGMPMNVMAMAMGSDMIDVSWDAPADDGGSMVTGYMVQRAYMMANGSMSAWTDAYNGTAMMFTDMDLMEETTYYYRVAAMNAIGMGAYSDGRAMAMTAMAATMAPTGSSATSFLDSITVSWTPGSAQGTSLLRVALIEVVNGQITALADVPRPIGAYNLMAGDPGVHTFIDVPSGSYRVALVVTARDGSNVIDLLPNTLVVN